MTDTALDARALRAFIAVAEELHFGRAARRLHLSQPPLSVQIRKLEDSLGARLFERSRRHVALTEAGAFLLGRARHLVAEAERTEAEVKRIARGEGGVLAIAYTPTATYRVLPRIVPRFRTAHPSVRAELVEMRSVDQPDAIREGRVELGFACAPVDAAGLASRTVERERLVVALPARHPLARRQTVDVRALAREPFVVVRRDVEPAWAEPCAHALAARGIGLVVAQETDTKLALLGLVAAGIGVSVVSESMACLAREGVAFRRLRGVDLRLGLAVLSRPSPSPRAQALLALL